MRKISVLGDSISTFEGYQPKDYAVYYNRIAQLYNGMADAEDTWWMQVIHYLDGELLVNDAYSGSRVSGKDFPSAACMERLRRLAPAGQIPDVILVYIGFNDFGYGVRIQQYPGRTEDYDSFADSYDRLLKRLTALYPSSEIICGTLMKTVWKEHEDWVFPPHFEGEYNFEDYNQTIRETCGRYPVRLADLEKTGLRYETLDSTHGTAAGHKTIAQAWIQCLEAMRLNK